ncbi:hypothetical protein TKK_0012569 [Trichogramma kaykai]
MADEGTRLLSTQLELVEVMRALGNVIDAVPYEEWILGLAQARFELLENYWSDFLGNHLALATASDAEARYDRPTVYVSVQELYTRAKGILYDAQTRLQPPPQPRSQRDNGVSNVESTEGQSYSRLPRINVPEFSGRREDWESFRDLYRVLIHRDPNLSNVERLFYLKTLVKGEAQSALSALQLTADNYDTAWAVLESRYENRRLLVQEHLTALRSMKPIREDSVKAIQYLMDTLGRHRDQLRTLKCSVDHWDDWFVSIAASCMDSTTRYAWEAELERLDAVDEETPRKGFKLATFDTLHNFLNSRCRMAVACSSNTAVTSKSQVPSINERTARSYATNQENQTCAQCHGAHYLGHCTLFTNSPLADRRALVARAKLCFNCLRPGHVARVCPSQSTCQVCRAAHHTTLHEGNRRRPGSPHDSTAPAKNRRTTLATFEVEASENKHDQSQNNNNSSS